ncbi:MAG TPA: non-homologous end-joining DNA ligase [Thermoanaerobaculia bacterium]|nr:non-homologous end-joining DNA ligase [Thermoanaerobaculia bacterium]
MTDSIYIDGRTVELSNTGKVLFPDAGITKGDLVEYYRRVAPTMLPHLRGRPVSMQRFPDGIGGKRFFQKDAPDYFPDWIRFEEVAKEGGTVRHVVCDDAATLVYLANQACITPHVWLSRVEHLELPDRMIFDLDPPDASEKGLAPVRQAARTVRDRLRELGFEPFLTTTGSRGFHVVVPLEPEAGFDEVRAFAHALARELAARQPDRLTVETRKDKRGDRVFLDYLRNGYAQTAVPPYAVRARPGAPVATPVSWDELSGLDPRRYTVKNLFQRLGQKEDPWAEIDRHRKPLGDARDRLEAEV